MNEYEFNGKFLYCVRLIKRLYERALADAAAESGLSLPEADVLSFLREYPEFDTARDIALYREVSKAYVSNAVEALTGKGYLTAVRDTRDRRVRRLALTPAAGETAQRLYEGQIRFYDSITRGIPMREVNGMLALLATCAQNVQRAAEEYRIEK
ncbi:MAG: MarR family transcriptional regulator [Firmicutes bacterium]|nr:MarR family transcriptional regulator [Bacillota bacterium]